MGSQRVRLDFHFHRLSCSMTCGIFPDQRQSPCLLHCRWILYCLNHQGRLHQDHERQSEMESHSVVSDSLQSHGLYSPRNSPGQNTGVGSLSLPQGIFPTQGSNSGLPHCRRISLPAEPQGKPKNTGKGSLSLLQQIFPTQELNQDLLHCRWILYQLSYQRSPTKPVDHNY